MVKILSQLGLRNLLFKRKDINNGSGDNNNDNKVTSEVRTKGGCSQLLKKFARGTKLRKAMALRCFSIRHEGGAGRSRDRNKKGDGGGSGSSGGDGHGDNDGGNNTEGGGGGGKMGTKMEPKGQQDSRNKYRYHAGHGNGYSAGLLDVLKTCNQEKPNVCSIIPHEVLFPVGQMHRCNYEKPNVYAVIHSYPIK